MSPNEIEDILGIAGTRSLPKDLDSKYRPRREWNIWMTSTENELASTDNIKHIKHLLATIKGKESLFEQLQLSGCEAKISCFWESTGQGGPALDCELMKELTGFGIDISWDIYFDA